MPTAAVNDQLLSTLANTGAGLQLEHCWLRQAKDAVTRVKSTVPLVPMSPPPHAPLQPSIKAGDYLWELIYPRERDMVPARSASGQYAVRLYVMDAWRSVVVDDQIPVDLFGGWPHCMPGQHAAVKVGSMQH
jgi:hypothetical protein